MATYFSEHFKTSRAVLDRYGAFDVSLVTDLPLFIDPFLLFNSRKKKYRTLHDEIIQYLRFLRDKADEEGVTPGLLDAWFRFPEVKQTWLGFARSGNRGSGLGRDFAQALYDNLHRLFRDFGAEQITRGSHLEKLCLIKGGVGRDNISDFTTNLIKAHLCEYTQEFARLQVRKSMKRRVTVRKVRFNYETETWETAEYELPWTNGDYVLLTPKDILARDDTWINRRDLIEDFDRLPEAVSNEALRAQVNNYFVKALGPRRRKAPTRKERAHAAASTILEFPALIDVYIKSKEDQGDRAQSVSAERVEYSEQLYLAQCQALGFALLRQTGFYGIRGDTYSEVHQRVAYLKDVIENKGGHRFFYVKGQPIEREEDLHLMFRLTWFGTPSDVGQEVNDGRGPVDFKVSRGARDKTLVEFKLARNPALRRNLEKQVEIYKRASDARKTVKVVIYFTEEERKRVEGVLAELKLSGDPDVILVDARRDNKPSGSKA